MLKNRLEIFLWGVFMVVPLLIAGAATGVAAEPVRIIENIVVTAQKREQNSDDIAIALTAFTGATLDARGIDRINDLQFLAPNLSIKNQFGSSAAVFDIRGVSLASFDTSSTSPVTVYFDEIAAAYPVMTQGQFFDVSRVEILRGPQGDLFGKNTTGGAISFFSNRPTDELDAGVTFEYGNYERYKIEGYVSGALGDGVRMRLAATTTQAGKGWQENRAGNSGDFTNFDVIGETDGQRLGEVNIWAVRTTLEMDVSEELQLSLQAHYSKDRSDSVGLVNLAPFNINYELDNDPNTFPDFTFPVVATPGDLTGTDWQFRSNGPFAGRKPGRDNEGWGLVFRMNYDFENFELISITGYEEFDREELLDYDATAYAVGDSFYESHISSFSEEVRLTSAGDVGVNWIVGAFYGEDSIDENYLSDLVDSALVGFAPQTTYEQKTQTWALFGHVEYELNSAVNITGGLRYTDETRKLSNAGTGLGADPFGAFTGLYDVGDNLTDSFGPCLFLAICTGVADRTNLQTGFSEVSGKLAVEWRPQEATLLYVSVARGVKSGGFNGGHISSSTQYGPYAPETLWSYEAGLKALLLEGHMQVNGSIYYYDYKNRQVSSSIADPFFGPLVAYRNAPSSELYGAELEVNWLPVEGLNIRQTLSFKKGKFKDFPDVDINQINTELFSPGFIGAYSDAVNINRAGESTPGSEWQYGGAFSYEWELTGALGAEIATDYSYEGKSRSLYGDAYGLESYWLVNARIVLSGQDERWQVTFWAKNLFNEHYFTDKNFYNEALLVGAVGLPRTYGVRLAFKL